MVRALPLFFAALALCGCTTWQGARGYQRGTAALERGDPALAVAELERAASLVPNRSEVQNHLGLAYDAAGRPRDAIVAWKRAVALDCENTAAQHNLAVAEARAAGELR